MDWTMFSAISVLVIAAIAAGWKIMKAFADKDRLILEAKVLNKTHQIAEIERRITDTELHLIRIELATQTAATTAALATATIAAAQTLAAVAAANK